MHSSRSSRSPTRSVKECGRRLGSGTFSLQRDGRHDDDRGVLPGACVRRRAARRAPRRAGRRGAAAARGATRRRRRGSGRSAPAAGAATRAGRPRGRAPGGRRRRRRASGARGSSSASAASTYGRSDADANARPPSRASVAPPGSSVKWLRRGRRGIVQAKRPRGGAAGSSRQSRSRGSAPGREAGRRQPRSARRTVARVRLRPACARRRARKTRARAARAAHARRAGGRVSTSPSAPALPGVARAIFEAPAVRRPRRCSSTSPSSAPGRSRPAARLRGAAVSASRGA